MRRVPAALLAFTLLSACGRDPKLREAFVDTFDRTFLGPDYYNSGGSYRMDGEHLLIERGHNHPLWLRRRLPADVRIEFDITGGSPDGDLKIELQGDGESAEPDDAVRKDAQYHASGYVLIFGGWRNSRSLIARQDEHQWEHGVGVPQRVMPKVQPGRTYHFAIVQHGGSVDWSIDGETFLRLEDSKPFPQARHDHFGFSGWEAPAVVDNLRITPLSN
jgi:hypothetical protein